jgi:hypothetical protein
VGEHIFSHVEFIQLRRLCLFSNLMGRVCLSYKKIYLVVDHVLLVVEIVATA